MLRIAVPNKGSLSETASQMLEEAGYSVRKSSRQLVHEDPRNNVELFYLRPRDIATYVGSGALDVGITGRDLLLDSETEATEIAELEFADSTFRFAAADISDISGLEGKVVATSYPKLVADFLNARGISVEVVKLDGAVESAVRLGVADAVADVVSTGATLRAAGLQIFGPVILESTALLIGTERTKPQNNSATERLLDRLRGVMLARKFVMMEYDLAIENLEKAAAIASGIEAPTVMPLTNPDWVAVRVMVPAADTAPIMDQLHDIGAKAIIVTALHAARM
jgi:ATP phosphoribosyltransferase